MIIDEELIQKLAHLARMKLTAEEAKKFSDQLDEILSFFEKLKEVDTSDVQPVSQITGLENVTRKDVPAPCTLSNALLECSPQEVRHRQVHVQKAL